MLLQMTTEINMTILFVVSLSLIALFLYLIMNIIAGGIKKGDLTLDAKVKKKKKKPF